jgi:outer membrane protein assembly factor BamB
VAVGVGIAALFAGLWMARAEGPAAAPAGGELKVLKSFAGDGNGRWDYLTVDSDARRVYVPRSTWVQVFDADSGKVVGEVEGTPGVHGVALAPKQGLGFASCGGDGTVAVFDLKTLKVTKKVKAGQNPDAILYDPFSQKVFAFNHKSGDVTIVDPAALDKDPVTVAVGGTLEYGASDGAGHVYVNVEDKSEVAVIDSKEMKVTARWPVAPGESPTGLAMDVARGRLYVGCGGNQKMIVLDANTGKVLADLPAGKGIDGAEYDAQLGLAVTANGQDGTLTAVREGPAGKFTVVQTAATVKSARTVADDPKTHCFLLPCTLAGEGGAAGKFALVVVGAGEAGAASKPGVAR